MKNSALALILLAACAKEAPIPEPTDTRQPIATMYVTAPELKVHAQANDSSPVVATYQNGEGVSILAKQGDWAEIRVGDASGWGVLNALGTGEAAKQQEETPTARFRVAPSAVANVTAHGEVYIEASVNTDGDVISTRIISNSTGSDALAAQNAAALSQAKFYPIMKNGERQVFKYYHRVTY